ncbi:hypothetical protein [Nocardia sp. NPDC051981]|uniref:hypothetical protein n=1 Tax=Nocardia sp. NPDC051981 TaxID=3155417 RepID=UPI00342149E4
MSLTTPEWAPVEAGTIVLVVAPTTGWLGYLMAVFSLITTGSAAGHCMGPPETTQERPGTLVGTAIGAVAGIGIGFVLVVGRRAA